MLALSPAKLDQERILRLADSLSVSGQVMARVNRMLRSPVLSIDDLAKEMRIDPALSAHVVRIANSPYYQLGTEAKSLEEALQRVGVGEVVRLMNTAALQNFIPGQLRHYGLSGKLFFEAALFSALCSQQLATHAGLDGKVAYLAGLMRPLGVLIFEQHGVAGAHAVQGDAFAAIPSLADWEREAFGFTHAEASALVLRHWNFPAQTVRAVEQYDLDGSEDLLGTVLYGAGALASVSKRTFHPSDHNHRINRDWMTRLNLPEAALPQIALTALRQARILRVG